VRHDRRRTRRNVAQLAGVAGLIGARGLWMPGAASAETEAHVARGSSA
jgi:hypothetical protein